MEKSKKVDQTHSKMDLQAVFDQHVASLGDAVNTGIGNAVGNAVASAQLGDRQSTGTVPFSQTPGGKRRKRMSEVKGIAANREF